MSEHIEAKPTIYRSVQFKSRLEARWAVFFDYYHLINEWVYEATTLTLPEKGWEYTPDFKIVFGGYPMLVEIKPVDPTPEYYNVLECFGLRCKEHPLLLCVGDFYIAGSIHGENLTHRTKLSSLTHLFPSSQEAGEIARNYRFDIPYTPPAFRRGSMEVLKENISRQQSTLRKENRRKRK